MSDQISDSPASMDALLDALDAEAGQGTSSTPPNPADAPASGEAATQDGVEPSQPKDGITAPKPEDGKANPPAEQKQSPYPKELEPFKSVFEGKKWDPTKPEWQVEALRTLQESEQFQGRLTTDLGLTRTHAAELNQAILGSPQDVNAYRQRHGLPPIPFESTSLEDKYKAAEADWNLLQEALKGSEDATAKLAQAFQKRLHDIELDRGIAARMPQKPATVDANPKLNWANIVQKDPEANKVMSTLVPFLKSPHGVGVLGTFGMDIHNVMSTPERAAQIYDLATRVHRGSPEVFEAEVTKRVKAEMEQNRQRMVAGDISGGAPATPSNSAPDAALEHLQAAMG